MRMEESRPHAQLEQGYKEPSQVSLEYGLATWISSFKPENNLSWSWKNWMYPLAYEIGFELEISFYKKEKKS